MSHEAFCSTEIDPEGLTTVTDKTDYTTTIAKMSLQQDVTGTSTNRTNNHRCLKEKKYLRIPK